MVTDTDKLHLVFKLLNLNNICNIILYLQNSIVANYNQVRHWKAEVENPIKKLKVFQEELRKIPGPSCIKGG